ncbi:MAG TPA: hypothetical protein VIJ46_03755 [Rhabdochlamydiaceae bacterium]
MTAYSFAAKHLLELKRTKEAEAGHIVEVFHELHTSDHPHLESFHDYLRTTELPVHDTKDLLHSLSLSQALSILVRNESVFTVPGTEQLANTSKLQHVFIEHFYTSPAFDQLLSALK